MATRVNPALPRDKDLATKVLENEKDLSVLESEKGWIGAFWGNSKNAPNNIAGVVILTLTMFGLIYTLIIILWYPTDKVSSNVKDIWAIITPLITLSLGYLFGKHSSGDDATTNQK